MSDTIYLGDYKNGEIEISQPNQIFQNKYITVFNDLVLFPDGHTGTYIRVTTPFRKSVAVLPLTSSGKIILIKTFRHGARGWGLEIPKGGVEKHEESLVSAKRELLEETGFASSKWKSTGEYSESPAIISGTLKCYIAYDCVAISKNSIECTEAISNVLELTQSEYFAMSSTMDYRDALTELLVLKYTKGD